MPRMRLPLEACAVFEKAFDLSWDVRLQIYFLDEDTHSRLVQDKPSVSFSIGSGPDGPFQNFTLPYSAFDLQLTSPLVDKSDFYFPIRRATNAAQYMLGRTFLQEAYLTVDYGRANFSLSQAYATDGFGYIMPILNATSSTAVNNGTPGDTDSDSKKSRRKGISTSATAGISIAVGVVILALIALRLLWKKKWGVQSKKTTAPNTIEKAELHADTKSPRGEMTNEHVELPDDHTAEAMEMERETAELEAVEPCHGAGGPISTTFGGVNSLHELDRNRARSA